jgi:hypothetical protein
MTRRFISAMQVTLDGYILGPDGESDWVDSWADGLGLLPRVDAFVLGGGMFPEYEAFWTAIREDATGASEMLGRPSIHARSTTRTPPPRRRTWCFRQPSPTSRGRPRESFATSMSSGR